MSRSKVRKVEIALDKVAAPDEVITLRDGTQMTLPPEARFLAFNDAFQGKENELVDLIVNDEIDLSQNPDLEEFAAFLRAFQAHAGASTSEADPGGDAA